ncbi:MAG: Hg(II)-responsive transcriptional regulator [Gammaproteobacteria bacterium]|nr:Hg(II)-responsive transcriptional regulator [Gammaproteobacteria bacterium]
MLDDKTFTIGALARTAGVNVETIRYYQRRGLLPKPGKPVAGYRRYPAETLARLRFIKRAQELGFTLREVADLLRLDGAACGDARALAVRKRADIEARMKDLQAMRRTLNRLLRACEAGGQVACPIIDSLNKEKP